MTSGTLMTTPTRQNPFGESEAAARARRQRSIAIALGLVAFVALVFVVSILKLSAHAG
jgi:hypothetical protein